MKELIFRKLRADEIDARVAKIGKEGLSLLLYKDARVDQKLLDETVGPMNWQREHCRDNANCIVSIWDEEKSQWIRKEDTGTESNTEAEKGLASDSFKRACFNWGIGRELYTAPFIWVPAGNYTTYEKNGKLQTSDRFRVTAIGYDDDGNINQLTVINTKTKKVVFEMSPSAPRKRPEAKKADNPAPKAEKPASGAQAKPQGTSGKPEQNVMIGEAHWFALKAACKDVAMDPKELLERYQVAKPSEISITIFKDMMDWLESLKKDYDQTGLPFQTPA